MKNAMQLLQSLLLAFVLSSLCGCSLFRNTKPSVVERAPGFTGEALVQKGAVVATIVTASDLHFDHDSSGSALANSLRAHLVGLYPQMVVLGAGSVEGALGTETYAEWSGSYQLTGRIESDSLPHMLPALLDSVGYLIVGRIEADEVSKREQVDNTYEKDKPPVKTGTTYYTTRKTTMRITIFDLHSGAQSWDGDFQVSHTQNHTVSVSEESEGGFIDALLTSLIFGSDSEPKYTYPPPDSNQDQAKRVYKKMAKELFEPDES